MENNLIPGHYYLVSYSGHQYVAKFIKYTDEELWIWAQYVCEKTPGTYPRESFTNAVVKDLGSNTETVYKLYGEHGWKMN